MEQFRQMANLRVLNALVQSDVHDLSPLAGLTNLTHLQLHLVDETTDITLLAGLTNLTLLNLRVQGNEITDITPLAGLTTLTTLNLSHNNIINLTPLAGLTNLTSLELENNNRRSVSPESYFSEPITPNFDLTPLAGLTNLTTLNLTNNFITNITPLTGLTNLTTLYLTENTTNITPLAGLTNLTYLDLTSNDITDITPLAGLTNLTTLGLRENSIADLTPLAGLTSLTRLDLEDNLITDLAPLAGLTNLTTLYLAFAGYLNITDWSPVAHIPTVYGRPADWQTGGGAAAPAQPAPTVPTQPQPTLPMPTPQLPQQPSGGLSIPSFAGLDTAHQYVTYFDGYRVNATVTASNIQTMPSGNLGSFNLPAREGYEWRIIDVSFRFNSDVWSWSAYPFDLYDEQIRSLRSLSPSATNNMSYFTTTRNGQTIQIDRITVQTETATGFNQRVAYRVPIGFEGLVLGIFNAANHPDNRGQAGQFAGGQIHFFSPDAGTLFAPGTMFDSDSLFFRIDGARPITATLNGAPISFVGQPPAIVNDRTLAPVRGIFENLGFNVTWNENTRQAVLSRGTDTVVLTIGSTTFTVNGMPSTLEVPAQIIGGSTMIPLRAVLEAFGYSLDWNAATNTINIGGAGQVQPVTAPAPADVPWWDL